MSRGCLAPVGGGSARLAPKRSARAGPWPRAWGRDAPEHLTTGPEVPRHWHRRIPGALQGEVDEIAQDDVAGRRAVLDEPGVKLHTVDRRIEAPDHLDPARGALREVLVAR